MLNPSYPYPSKRHLVYGRNGMVATGNITAADAGLDILKAGGNAVDAAIAAALMLTVTEPTANGLGGDLFAIVYFDGRYYGLSSHGPSPAAMSLPALRGLGMSELPRFGVLPINVPGQIAGIAALARRFARLPLKNLAIPAMRAAADGYALQPAVADHINRARDIYEPQLKAFPELETWFQVFGQKSPYRPGDRMVLSGHARALEAIAETDGEAFYRGPIADAIASFCQTNHGWLDLPDLAAFEPEWVTPISAEYKGHTIYEIPPSGQGIAVLMALRTLAAKGYTCHYAIEALKQALHHAGLHVADTEHMRQTVAVLLNDYPVRAAHAVNERAVAPETTDLLGNDTVYLAAADGDGNMVSLIQSNYMGFGSGVVIPEYGIALNNRACNFSLDETSANVLAPGKRPYHTIIPGFIEKKGEFRGPFGVMGGFMQPQGHLQVLLSQIEDKLNPQAALDRPRWQWIGGNRLLVEPEFDAGLLADLRRRGHEIEISEDEASFGRGQIIYRYEDGRLEGACEPRTDSLVAAY